MPRGFLRSTSAEVGGRIIVVRIAVQRLVPASDPRSYAVSVHFTWNELGEARTTLVICTDTVRSPTLANGEVERAYSPRNCAPRRSEEHTSELQSLMRISYAVFCLKKKKRRHNRQHRVTCEVKD